jgi:CRISPR-associated protein Cas2
MWAIVMFDLPVDTKKARRRYALFRKMLLTDGFQKLQFSVYARACSSRENLTVHVDRVQEAIPRYGEVRIIELTDKQFERMRVFFAKRRVVPEPTPRQLELF